MGSLNGFWSATVLQIAVLVALVAFQLLPSPAGRTGTAVELIRRTVRTRGLSAEAREEQTAGYYQELLDGAANVVAPTPGGINELVGGPQVARNVPVLEELEANQVSIHERLHEFRVYRPLPNLDLRDPRFSGVRYVTNSLGFGDHEYALERLPNTRRLVVLGDSLARGLGVEPGGGFDAQLEARLNDRSSASQIRGAPPVEMINMAVSGYRITQIVDVALDEGARFRPDTYVVVVSWLTVARKWGLHLAQLANDGIDAKYDFLRRVVEESGLQKGETESKAQARLAPFMLPTVRWALGEIDKAAKSQGAELLVVLMPHLKGVGFYDADFEPIRDSLRNMNVPFVDLLDAFNDVDTATLDVGDGLHPNARGHAMLADRLYDRILVDKRLRALWFGAPNSTVLKESGPKTTAQR
jgi:lysophospholipase L1-like esterase